MSSTHILSGSCTLNASEFWNVLNGAICLLAVIIVKHNAFNGNDQ